uniref:Uncharacterized protein n=1 Tax=Pseudomonas phage HRDY3 TaxID=3236930 RepID=A0AB39CDT9_9VIRU
MPILADSVQETIEDDAERYLQMVASGELRPAGVFAMYKAIPFRMYLGTDRLIGNSLATCRLLVLTKGDEIVYSCYYKVAENEYFATRAVQVEVRQTPRYPGLARAVMRHHFMREFDSLRTDLSGTECGRNMWRQFYKDYRKELHFYKGFVNIDLRKSDGSNNQDAACPDKVTHLKHMKTGSSLRDEMWHDNKDGNVVVIYATKVPLWTE